MRALAWTKDNPVGAEFVEASVAETRLSVVGVAVGSDQLPYRLDYVLETAADFVTTRFHLTTRGDRWRRTLDLRRARDGEWSATVTSDGAVALPSAGGEMSQVAGALDVDLGLSPLTNTMPVLRDELITRSGAADFLMAWISVPDLAVTPSAQRYTVVRPLTNEGADVRFELLDDDFTASIAFDQHGFVVDYPGIARRIT